MRCLSLLAIASTGLVACAGPCEDDGFGQTDCPVASGTQGQGSTGGAESSGPSSSGAATAIPLPTSPTSPGTGSSSGESSSDGTSTPTSTGSESGDTTTGEPPNTEYCADVDLDGFGDPLDCTDVPDGDEPPQGWVTNADDCDDTDGTTHPGAASNKDLDACTKDADGDGWGDASPAPGVVAGTDCDDDSLTTFPGAAELEPELCTNDEDNDGYGATSVPAGVDPGTDCIDTNEFAFPGAADLDDAVACMEDVDDDGYGNSMPPAGAMAGTDCDDGDEDVPSVNACLVWCRDADGDQYGDASDCVLQATPPMDYVGNGEDCDDTDPFAFPGAAQNESATACMRDFDDDGFGDDDPGGAIDAGTDCDDIDANVQVGCFDCPAGTLACDANEDLTQCNATGTFAFVIEDCDYGCDDVGLACWPELTVDAQVDGGTCSNVASGGTVDLSANAMGGDGNYTYAWTPAGPLDDATAASPTATVNQTTTFAVSVSDGEGNNASDGVTVHTSDFWDLGGPGCQGYAFAHPLGTPNPPTPNPVFFSNSNVYCTFAGDTPAFAWVCPTPYQDARITFEMQVLIPPDNDAIGFVWGWQDAAHFYVMSWKQATESTAWGTWEEGVTIKRISAPSQDAITAADLFLAASTPNSTLLADPGTFFDQGWADSTRYDVELDTATATHTITLRELSSGNLVAQGTVADATYPSGAVGSFDASQNTACNGFWSSSCLP